MILNKYSSATTGCNQVSVVSFKEKKYVKRITETLHNWALYSQKAFVGHVHIKPKVYFC